MSYDTRGRNKIIHFTLYILIYLFTINTINTKVTEIRKGDGTLTSLNHPGLYPPNTNDSVIVEMDNLHSFVVTISHLSLEYSLGCKADHLTLYEGIDIWDTWRIVAGPLCGKLGENRNLDGCPETGETDTGNASMNGLTFLIYARQFMITFVSDKNVESTGFIVDYTSKPASLEAICSRMMLMHHHEVVPLVRSNMTTGGTRLPVIETGLQIEISSSFVQHTNQYQANINCEWTIPNIVSDEQYLIFIDVTFFSIEYSGSNCSNDKMEVWKISDKLRTDTGITQPLMTLCGSLHPFHMTFDNVTRGIRLTFTANDRYGEGGFHLLINRTPKIEKKQKVSHEINVSNTKDNFTLTDISHLCQNPSCHYHITFVSKQGYCIDLKLSDDLKRKITVHDGPTSEYQDIQYRENRIQSRGFYLTIFFESIAFTNTSWITYTRLLLFSPRLYELTNCEAYGVSDGVLTEINALIIKIKGSEDGFKEEIYDYHIRHPVQSKVYSTYNYFCYITVTVPDGYTISVKVSDMDFSHSHVSNACLTEGIIVYDGSLKLQHRLGPFCETENGYLKSMFNPLLTSSNRAYIMLYSYAKIGEKQRRDINIHISASKCKGVHITPFYMRNSSYSTPGLEIQKHEFMTHTNITVDVKAIQHESLSQCAIILFHSEFHKMLYVYQFIQLTSTKVLAYKYFEGSSGEPGDIEFETDKQNVVITNNTAIINMGTNVSDANNSNTWTVGFTKVIIGDINPKPAAFIHECMGNTTELTQFSGFISLNKNMVNYEADTMSYPCIFSIVCRSNKNCNNRHYFELYLEAFQGRMLEIEETPMRRKVIKTEYKTTRYRTTYRSFAAYRLNIKYYYATQVERTDGKKYNYGLLKIHYRIKPYKNPTEGAGHTFQYDNHQYVLPTVNLFNNNNADFLEDPFSHGREVCKARGGNLLTISTTDELNAVKTHLATANLLMRIRFNFPNFVRFQRNVHMENSITFLLDMHKITKSDGTMQWRWADGSPITISEWYIPYNVDNYVTEDNSRKLGRLAWTVQPNAAYNCAYMTMYHSHRSTNWQTVNCDYVNSEVIKDFLVLCKIPNNVLKRKTSNVRMMLADMMNNLNWTYVDSLNTGGHQISQNSSNTDDAIYLSPYKTYKFNQLSRNMKCPANWIYINGKCWLMLRGDFKERQIYTFNSAQIDCVRYGGTVADITDLTIAKIYMTYSRHFESYGNVWIRSNMNESCILYRVNRNLNEAELDLLEIHEGSDCTRTDTVLLGDVENEEFWRFAHSQQLLKRFYVFNIGVRALANVTKAPRSVLCVRDAVAIPKTCRIGYFTCRSDNSCLSHDMVCDGFTDCNHGEDEENCDIADYYFTCESGDQRIIVSKYCDFVGDCRDASDEEGCVYPPCSDAQFRCDNGECVNGTTRCNGRLDGCVDLTDEWDCEQRERCINGYTCYDGTCIAKNQVNDGRVDCGDSSDEPYLYLNTKNLVNVVDYVGCLAEEARCDERNIGCFNRGEACLLRYDTNGDMTGCSNGAHLSNCSTFECPGFYKCPESYCIDITLVCNGIQDCRYGEDEAECHDVRYPVLYRCGGNQTNTVDGESICDGKFDCERQNSDEKYCNLPNCPDQCVCRAYYYNCEGTGMGVIGNGTFSILARTINLANNNLGELIYDRFNFSSYSFLAILRLSHNDIDLLWAEMFDKLYNLITLDLSYNTFSVLPKGVFKHLWRLKNLNFDGNMIKILSSDNFVGLSMIEELNLSRLGISEIRAGSFSGLLSIKSLDLSQNNINLIENGVFDYVHQLNELNLSNNLLSNVPSSVFADIRSRQIETDAYRFCCYTNKVISNCTPDSDIYFSCDDLMSNRFLQIIIWVIGMLSVVGNISVMICRLVIGVKTPSEVCIFALSCSDLLTGVYLVIIASTDTYYRGEYIYHDVEWRESFLCQFCGVISTLSSQLSSFLLLLITLDRFIHLVFPLKAIRYSRKSTIIACNLLFLISLLACVIPFFVPSYFSENYYNKTPICLAYDFTGISDGWEYTLAVFILVNLLNCIVTLVCYVIIYWSVRRSSKKSDPKRSEDIALAKTLFLLVLTDLVCWFPLIITSLSVLNGSKVPRDVAAMLAVVVLPINAALNPYLYTISSIQKARSRNSGSTRSSTGSTRT